MGGEGCRGMGFLRDKGDGEIFFCPEVSPTT